MRIFYAIKLPRISSEQKVVIENVAGGHLTRQHSLGSVAGNSIDVAIQIMYSAELLVELTSPFKQKTMNILLLH